MRHFYTNYAYATAFTDQSSEKSSLCNAISNAPIPDNNLTIYGCIPANNDLARPDLGSIDGVGEHINVEPLDAYLEHFQKMRRIMNMLN